MCSWQSAVFVIFAQRISLSNYEAHKKAVGNNRLFASLIDGQDTLKGNWTDCLSKTYVGRGTASV
jgi:hypothetical protein